MPNIQVQALFNQSKHQMQTDFEIDGVPTADPANGSMVILLKEVKSAIYNQQQMYSLFTRAVNGVREQNLLDSIAAGDWDLYSHVAISLTREGGGYLVQGVEANNLYLTVPAESISISIPTNSVWTDNSASIYLDTIAKRLYEKFLEDFAKKV